MTLYNYIPLTLLIHNDLRSNIAGVVVLPSVSEVMGMLIAVALDATRVCSRFELFATLIDRLYNYISF